MSTSSVVLDMCVLCRTHARTISPAATCAKSMIGTAFVAKTAMTLRYPCSTQPVQELDVVSWCWRRRANFKTVSSCAFLADGDSSSARRNLFRISVAKRGCSYPGEVLKSRSVSSGRFTAYFINCFMSLCKGRGHGTRYASCSSQ